MNLQRHLHVVEALTHSKVISILFYIQIISLIFYLLLYIFIFIIDKPIEKFSPPKGATMAELMQWEDAVAEMVKGISKLTVGGQALRDQIKTEVRRLQLFRFEMFCKYVTEI